MTPKRPSGRVSARGPKGNSAGNGPKRPTAQRAPRYPKGHPNHPEMLKMAERARRAAIPKPETKPEALKRIKKATIAERAKSWAEESLAANLNDSRILQLRRLYDHLSVAVATQSQANVVKLETLIAKIQGTLEPAVVEDPAAEKGPEGDDPFPGKSDLECGYYAETGLWPTAAELANYQPQDGTVN